MAKLTSAGPFDAEVIVGGAFPIDLEVLAGTSPVALTQGTRSVHVTADVNWLLSTPWASGGGHGILNTIVKVNQQYPTPYFMILNEGTVINTNTTTAPGSGTSIEAHNVIFLWKGGSVTNASGALLEQRSADDGVGAIHFEQGLTGPNELYNDGTIKSGLIAVFNRGQFHLENTGTIEGNVYSTYNNAPTGQTSYLENSAAGKILGKQGANINNTIDQAAVFMFDTKVDIKNDGAIESSGRYGIYTPGNSLLDLTNSGTIESKFVGGASAVSFGVFVSEGGTIDNSGIIQGEIGLAFGRISAPLNKVMTLTNSGTITGSAYSAIEALILDTISITNTATGEIVAETTESGVVLSGVTARTQTSTIDNAGLIKGAVGISLLHATGAGVENLTIKNSGTISAHTSTGTAISSWDGTKVSLEMQAGGQLVGGISALGSTDGLSFTGTGEINGTVVGMEAVTIETSAHATITGDLSGFATATVDNANLNVGGALTGTTITLTSGRLELSGSAASSITTFSADAHSELHINNLTAAGKITADSVSIDGVKLTIGSSLDAELTLIEIDGDTTTATGTFEGLAEGANLSIGSSTYSISYVGGDGNDIVLTRTSTSGSGGGGTPTPTPVVPIIVDVLPDNGEPVIAGPEAEIFTGTEATDMVVFSGNRSDYVITRNGDGTFTIKGSHAPDTLNSIERLQFDDGVLALDIDASPGLAFRLYLAAFSRDPDFEGLGYWIRQLDTDTVDISAVAESFINSPEFERTYGRNDELSNQQFVELLYLNTLGRDFDQEGHDYWLSKLEAGETNRADLLAFFADSQESREITADIIADGIWMI
jgi:hypothetical protein